MNTLTLNLPISITRPSILKWKIILRIFWIFSLISIIFLLSVYILQVNSVVSESYQVQNLERELKVVSQENEILEINLAQVNSLGNIEKLAQELGFEKVGQIHYIRVTGSQIVTK